MTYLKKNINEYAEDLRDKILWSLWQAFALEGQLQLN